MPDYAVMPRLGLMLRDAFACRASSILTHEVEHHPALSGTPMPWTRALWWTLVHGVAHA
jgi:hypothetical protein